MATNRKGSEVKKKQPQDANAVTASRKEDDFYVVGIGASAGGYEAIEKFFKSMPPDSGLTFIIIQHLSPDFKSMMVELLSKQTTMPVFRAEDNMEMKKNCIYLIPPKKTMTVFHNRLYLSEMKAFSHGLSLPINIFFRSLAEDKQDRAIGIVLSGTGTDGTLGIRDIKGSGGMVMVQDPMTSKFDGMPKSAIASGYVDFILSPDEMPEMLLKFISQLHITKSNTLEILKGKKVDNLTKILSILHTVTAMDFSHYKPSTIIRRLEKRMGINQITKLEDYVRFIEGSAYEANVLSQELLIGVTKFFRDPDCFDKLEKSVIPAMFKNRKSGSPLRVWAVGCSTGEEPYSLAILLSEYMERNGLDVDVKIFATDVDRNSLEYAGAGIYPDSIVSDVSPDRLSKYFHRKDSSFNVSESIRRMIVFAYHNIIADSPFNKVDLIICRNLLIYLQSDIQQKILSHFHFALNPEGFLFLGKSETVGEMANSYTVVDSKSKIYKKFGVHSLNLMTVLNSSSKIEKNLRPFKGFKRAIPVSEKAVEFAEAYKALMQTYEPSAVLVNEKNEPEYVFGNADNYLKISKGRMNLNIVKMVSDDLSVAVSTAIHRARRDKEEVVYKDIILKDSDHLRKVTLIVKPVFPEIKEDTFLFVVFEEGEPLRYDKTEGEIYDVSSSSNQRIKDLEQELQFTKENLQATVEELETSNEELQATNEELLASNEELQSTNEELQSVNEELITVNSEYQTKIYELIRMTNDYDNLLNSANIGTLFLDRELCIRKFTPDFKKVIKLIDSDIGRPLSNFSLNLDYPDFFTDIDEVLRNKAKKEKEVQTDTGDWYLIKILPYLTADRDSDGVIATLIDISRLKSLSAEVDLLIKAVELSPSMVVITDVKPAIVYVNRKFLEVTGYSMEEVTGANPTLMKSGLMHEDSYRQMWNKISKGSVWEGEFINRKKTGDILFEKASIIPIRRNDDKEISNFIKVSEDITVAKQNEEALKNSRQELKNLVAENTQEMKTILKNLNHKMFFKDTRSVYISCNENFAAAFHTTPENIIGKTDDDIFPEKLAKKHIRDDKRIMKSGTPENIEEESFKVNGKPVQVKVVKSPVRDEKGDIIGIAGILWDVKDK